MNLKLLVGAVLLVSLLVVSVHFERRYAPLLSSLAHEPAARFLAGMGLLWVASLDVTLGGLALVVLFLWIADIQLLSSTHVWKRKVEQNT
jgi:hypothetical protein